MKKSRRSHYGNEDPVCDSPSANERLVFSFHEIGQCKSNGMSIVPIDWPDIDAYCNRSMAHLDRWECTMIVRMSRVYVGYKNNDDPYIANPYQREFSEEDWIRRGEMMKRSLKEAKKDLEDQKKSIAP